MPRRRFAARRFATLTGVDVNAGGDIEVVTNSGDFVPEGC
jgi:hypothetical protein